MNGVTIPSVSAGSNQLGASDTAIAQVNCREGLGCRRRSRGADGDEAEGARGQRSRRVGPARSTDRPGRTSPKRRMTPPSLNEPFSRPSALDRNILERPGIGEARNRPETRLPDPRAIAVADMRVDRVGAERPARLVPHPQQPVEPERASAVKSDVPPAVAKAASVAREIGGLRRCGEPSTTAPSSERGVAQPGRAPALGAGCRRFKSSRPDQLRPAPVGNSILRRFRQWHKRAYSSRQRRRCSRVAAQTRKWVLEYLPTTARRPDPLMGWASTEDTLNEVRLHFDTLDEARAFAERRGSAARSSSRSSPLGDRRAMPTIFATTVCVPDRRSTAAAFDPVAQPDRALAF